MRPSTHTHLTPLKVAVSTPLILPPRRRPPSPPRLPPNLRRHNTPNRAPNNRRLDPKRHSGPIPRDPRQLKIRHRKPTEDPRLQDPRGRQARVLGHDIEQIRADRGRGAEGREHLHGPAEGEAYPGQVVLEGLAVEDEASDADEPGEVDAGKAGFGGEFAGVPADMVGGDEIVLEVAVELGGEGADHGGEEEEAEGDGGEACGWVVSGEEGWGWGQAYHSLADGLAGVVGRIGRRY